MSERYSREGVDADRRHRLGGGPEEGREPGGEHTRHEGARGAALVREPADERPADRVADAEDCQRDGALQT